jgi:protein arginine kinase activator
MQKHKDVMPINNPLSSLLASPIDKLLKIIKIIIKQGEINRELLGQYPCPDCGGTMVDFEETGRLGCAECYEFFREVLERISPQIQDNTLFSEQPVKTNHGESAIQSLELWMAECIQEEKYENAGTIKEMIKKLKEMK